MGLILNSDGSEAKPTPVPLVTIEESKPAERAIYPMSHFHNKATLDGCYILKDGRWMLRVALLDNADEKLVGWTYVDVVLVERIIKQNRRIVKLQKRKNV